MKKMRPWSTVRGRLVILAMAVELVMLSVLVFNGIRLLNGAMTDQVFWQASLIDPVLNAALRAPLAQQDSATVQAVLDECRITEGLDYAVVANRMGVRVAASGWPADRSLPQPTEPSALSAKKNVSRYDIVAPIALKGQLLGTLHFGLNLQKIISAKRLLALQSLAIAGIELLLSFIVLTILGYWLTRHLTTLMEASRQVTAGNLTPAPMREGADDVGRLGAAFNAMSRAIAERIADLIKARDNAELSAVKTDQLNRELEQQKALLDATIQSTMDLIFYKDLQGSYLGCNRAFEEFVGRPTVAIKGKTDYDLFPQEVAASFREQDLKMLGRGETCSNEEWITYPDGRCRLVETKKSPLCDTAGKTIGMIGVSRDVTERRAVEDRLRASEANFRAFFDATQDMIVVGEQYGRVFYVNKSVRENLGYGLEDLDGSGILGLHPVDLRCEAEEVFTSMFRGERDTCSLPLQSKDGRLLPVETRVFFGQWNGAACLFGVSRDLSAEQEAKQRFEKLFRYNPALMALRSMSDRRFVDANETFLKMMGYRQAEIIGKTSAELGLLPEPSDLAAEDALFATQGHVTGLELTVRSRDGSIRNGLFSGETIVIQGQSYVLIVMIDITQRKQAEAQLLAMNRQLEILTKQADDANRAKGVFLATMSHEIRTPMGGVLGMTGLLMRTALTDRQRHYTERIRTSGEALLSVIGDILDFSKIDSGMLQLDERIFSLKRDVLDRLWSIIGGPAEEKGLRVRVTSDEGLPLLLGDFRRLTQVLVNLLGNAVKFTEKGEVELSVRIREQDGERVSLSLVVRDTGIGIDQEQMTLLFKPFSQADPSTVRRYGGSGLGLTISKQIVELMGGEIAVESQPGRGSIFTVRLLLPVAPAIELAEREESASLADEEGVRFAGARVLLVEDQPINREIILELLRLDGIEADIAQDGREALDKVGGESYDLVLMDVQMPVMDGYAATREIRVKEAKKGARRLPIVALTAHAIAGDREKVEAAGMDDYLTKPLDPEAFHLALLRWLPREKRMVATAHLTGPTGTEEGLSADADLPGLDVAEGVQRVKGNETLYHKLLRNFVEDFGDLPEQLPQDLRTNRMVDAIHRVHSVKGVSGNLGGNELMAAAGSLEKALREMNDHPHFSVDEHLRVFIDCHQEFLATVTAYLALNPELVPEAPEGPRGTPEELQPLLENLRAALAAEEPRPCKEILRSLAQRRWPESVEAILAELRGLSDRYRLAEAHALLEGKGGDLLGEFGNIGGKNG